MNNGPIVVTVSQINKYVKSLLEENKYLKDIYVSGEISNYKHHYSGHIYMTIKDEKAAIDAVMFSSYAQNLKFEPEDGLKVVVRAKVSLYEANGKYQLYVTEMEPQGIGSLALAFEQLKENLAKKGLFNDDHKLSLPEYSQNIGLISSPTGAAVQDVLNVLSRRYPYATVYLYGVSVQGKGSAEQIIKAIKYFNENNNVNLIIIARGGGSIEDLWEFNNESLAYSIYESHIPIISGVGHETDFTICDFVADKRAPTPSAAAEIAVPEISEQIKHIKNLRDRLNTAINSILDSLDYRYTLISSSNLLKSPLELITAYENKVTEIDKAIDSGISALLDRKLSDYGILNSKLEALSPLKVLSRGYSLVKNDKGLVDSVTKLKANDKINIKFTDGEASAVISEV